VLAQRELGQFHPCNAMLFCKLAVLLQKRGSFKQALPFAKASFVLYEEVMLAGLDIEQEVLSINLPIPSCRIYPGSKRVCFCVVQMAKSCIVYADAVAAIGDITTAVQVAEEAVNILSAKTNATSTTNANPNMKVADSQELLKQAKLRLALLYEQAGSAELAISMCDNVLAMVKDAVKTGDTTEIPLLQGLTKTILRLHLRVQPLQIRALIDQLRNECQQDEIITEVHAIHMYLS
jgi:hypothetical protein